MSKNSNNSPGMIRYRVLAVDEWPNFPTIFEDLRQRGQPIPDPRFASITVAYNENQGVVGYLLAQVALHVEPLVAYSPHCIKGLFDCLDAHLMEKFGALKYFSTVTPGGVEERIANFVGMTDMGVKTYFKILHRETRLESNPTMITLATQ